jgi:hypothetical protein
MQGGRHWRNADTEGGCGARGMISGFVLSMRDCRNGLDMSKRAGLPTEGTGAVVVPDVDVVGLVVVGYYLAEKL